MTGMNARRRKHMDAKDAVREETPEWAEEGAMPQDEPRASEGTEMEDPIAGEEGGPQASPGDPTGPNEEHSGPETGGSPLYEDLRAVIANGNYKLDAMIAKCSRLWVEEQITEEEYDALVALARTNASSGSEVSNDLAAIVQQLMQRVTALEQKVEELEKAWSEDPDEPSEPVVTYEPYDPYKWYYKDMTCSFEGKNYICIAPNGQVCVWSPRDYPPYWKEVTE